MAPLDTLAERALSHLPQRDTPNPSLAGDSNSLDSGTARPRYTPQPPDFGAAANANASDHRMSPEPISIGSPTIQPAREPPVVGHTAAVNNAQPAYGPPLTPFMPPKLIKFLDNQFPSRSDYRDEMMDLGIASSYWLKVMDNHFRQDEGAENAEIRLVTYLESIMREWYSVNRPEIPGGPRGLAKLRFLDFKLKLRLHDMGYEREVARTQEGLQGAEAYWR
ncbi:hypothetical protein QQZ08_002029 [Neonectria magnoliae]|uniref:Uncharacterized protein n=1 Tax=Neonectria magnoliae TaxID=2732573 RepID=A0ABR1IFA7_9HYPO